MLEGVPREAQQLVRQEGVVSAQWNPDFRDESVIEARQLAVEVIIAIEDAGDELHVPGGTMILFDLRTSVSTRIVAMPAVMHVHDQDCARA